ncbi:Acyl-CoA Delta(11) desaturase [Halotydeus destructor]|nr:Acyl-CoA Delta(11) desaturase [Halotydeus destructor]
MSKSAKLVTNGGQKVGDKCYWFVDHGHHGLVLPFPSTALLLASVHIGYPFGVYHVFANPSMTALFWANAMVFLITGGLYCGAHSLWAHRSYEAKWPLRLVLMLLGTLSGQYSIYHWTTTHRVHHKWSDTDGDPHNSSRGFLYCHIGWIYKRQHPEYLARYASLDFSDLWNDPILRFGHEYHAALFSALTVLTWAVPIYFWGESLWGSLCVSSLIAVTGSHNTFLINSAAHMFGHKPYSTKIAPADNVWVGMTSFGAGYHNFHHMFPADYTSSDPGYLFNFGRDAIYLMSKVGLAYNLKTASKDMVEKLKRKVQLEAKNYGHKAFDELEDSNYDISK